VGYGCAAGLICHHYLLKTSFLLSSTTNAPTHLVLFAMASHHPLLSSGGLILPFVIHGITGEEYSTKSLKALKAIALQHLTDNRKILAIGHEKNPESIYNNPQLFPQMMPWLFPYGLGGIGNSLQKYKSADPTHKRHLLLYYDKCFQKDSHFPLIAFNHEQIKDCTTAGYLLAENLSLIQFLKDLWM